ncbi:hypothetical protein D9M71_788760 [compost metagenome]
MGVDIAHRGRFDIRLSECRSHALLGAFAFRRGGSNMVGVCAGAVADDLGEWCSVAAQRMF